MATEVFQKKDNGVKNVGASELTWITARSSREDCNSAWCQLSSRNAHPNVPKKNIDWILRSKLVKWVFCSCNPTGFTGLSLALDPSLLLKTSSSSFVLIWRFWVGGGACSLNYYFILYFLFPSCKIKYVSNLSVFKNKRWLQVTFCAFTGLFFPPLVIGRFHLSIKPAKRCNSWNVLVCFPLLFICDLTKS